MMNRNSLEKLFPSKELIKQAYSRKLCYDMWDKKSPIYVYNILIVRLGKCRIKDK